MSFILDAIKKSEAERKQSRQARLHSLQDQLQSRREDGRRNNRFLLLLSLLLFLALSHTWWRADTSWAPWLGERLSRVVEALDSTDEVPPQPGEALLPSLQSIAADARPIRQGVESSEGEQELPPRNEIKELWQLPADFQSTVPALEFSFHVYSREPLKRTIIINGRRVREGQWVSSGLALKAITENGVIMQYRGRVFHIDVIEKW